MEQYLKENTTYEYKSKFWDYLWIPEIVKTRYSQKEETTKIKVEFLLDVQLNISVELTFILI